MTLVTIGMLPVATVAWVASQLSTSTAARNAVDARIRVQAEGMVGDVIASNPEVTQAVIDGINDDPLLLGELSYYKGQATADSLDSLPGGTHWISTAKATEMGLPAAGSLLLVNRDSSYKTAVLVALNPTRVWAADRNGAAGWSIFSEVTSRVRQLTTENLDTLTTTGSFYQNSPTFATSERNYPFPTMCTIDVKPWSANNAHVTQVAIPDATGYSAFAIRSLLQGTWSDWDHYFSDAANAQKYALKSELSGRVSVWAGGSFIVLGDSVMANGAAALNAVRDELGFSSVENAAVAGRPMSDGSANGVGTVTTALTKSFVGHDLAIVAAGTNDFRLDMPVGTLGQIGDASFDRATFLGAYRTTIEHILTQNPTIRIMLSTPLQRDNASYDVNHVNAVGHKLLDYVDAVKEVGGLYGLPVYDAYANSGFTKLTLATLTSDGLHPNAAGYERLASAFSGFLWTVGS
ncbi:SGNH/GDSL hydrolase family protein [Gulosibacter molinativorax]|nr:SGNH/GDSL hydrolase family protein [Gulosibacter molinativorax]QUY60904.1 Hypotetical protein [Gulosibacter molinativorax]